PLSPDGIAELNMEMPDINGALRIMAAVVDGDRYGSSEHVIGVVAPIQILAAMPRAAAPGDVMAVPLRIRNNTSRPTEIALQADLGEGLDGALDAGSLLVPAHEEAHTTLTMVAGQPGSARVRISATPAQPTPRLQRQVLERWIAVRPPHGRDRSVLRLEAEPGARTAIDRDRSLETLAGHVEVIVGGHPAIDLKPVLDELIQYPYGCGEQTGSRTRGMLAALSLPREIAGRSPQEIRSMVAAGMHRLWWMQRSDGSIPYWRGGEASHWLTLRTALLALDARDADIPLPDGFLEAILNRTEAIARPQSGQASPAIAAHACRVLARADMPDEALMATTLSKLKSLDQTSRAHLAESYFAIGEYDQAQAIIEHFHLPEDSPPNDKGRFTSGVHQAAVAMDVLLRNQPDHPTLVTYARFINTSRSATGWSTTFENAAVVNALCHWHAQKGSDGIARGRITIAGEDIEFEGNTPVRHAFDIPPGGTTGEEFLVSEGDGPVALVVSTSGVPIDAEATAPLDSIIEITRTWFDSAGNPIEPGTPLNAG
ncbi:MAG: hypothetical protein MK100_10085, partial [Phycisphaerales bacterium]|nr:hypothetical protein [Phycisphaerales bacterium]